MCSYIIYWVLLHNNYLASLPNSTSNNYCGVLLKMVTMYKDLDGSIVCCETEEGMNSRECSEIMFNNGYTITIMGSSDMMDNTLQMIIQPSINLVKHSIAIYYYFSATFEVSKLVHIAKLSYTI